jgi:guanylate kinase
MIIISGSSGSGKSTVRKELIKVSNDFYYSVSATTRQPRDNEIAGVDYNYVTQEEFQRLIDKNEFIEYKQYNENSYGSPKKPVIDNLNEGKNVIFEINVDGALELMKNYPEIISIWISPPNYESLKKRLYDRATEPAEVIEKRLKIAKDEIEYLFEYDYLVINEDDKSAETAEKILNIIACENLKTERNKDFYENFYK